MNNDPPQKFLVGKLPKEFLPINSLMVFFVKKLNQLYFGRKSFKFQERAEKTFPSNTENACGY